MRARIAKKDRSSGVSRVPNTFPARNRSPYPFSGPAMTVLPSSLARVILSCITLHSFACFPAFPGFPRLSDNRLGGDSILFSLFVFWLRSRIRDVPLLLSSSHPCWSGDAAGSGIHRLVTPLGISYSSFLFGFLACLDFALACLVLVSLLSCLLCAYLSTLLHILPLLALFTCFICAFCMPKYLFGTYTCFLSGNCFLYIDVMPLHMHMPCMLAFWYDKCFFSTIMSTYTCTCYAHVFCLVAWLSACHDFLFLSLLCFCHVQDIRNLLAPLLFNLKATIKQSNNI